MRSKVVALTALFLGFLFCSVRAQNAPPELAKLNDLLLLGERCYLSNPDSALAAWLYIDSAVARKVRNHDAVHPALQKVQADAVNNIGLIYAERGTMNAALEYNFRSFRLREVLRDTHGIAESSNNIAFLYLSEHDTTRALAYFHKAQEGYAAVKDTGGIAYTLISQGQINAHRKQYAPAMQMLYQACGFLRSSSREQRGYTVSLNQLGIIHAETGNMDSALYYCRAALVIRQQMNDVRGIAGSYAAIGRAYLLNAQTDSALYYAKLSYDAALASQNAEQVVTNATLLSDVYKAQKKYEEAYAYYAISVSLRDSLTNKELVGELVRQELNYDYGKKIAADSTRNAIEQDVLDTELRASRQQAWYLIGILGLVGLFAVIVLNRFQVIRRQKRLIELQKKLVESKQKDILDSMEYATRIQNALLAGKGLLSSKFRDHFVFYRPRDIVSGDFYWATARDGSGKFYLAVCDSTGHGVPGAFMSLLNISFLNEAVSEKRISAPGRVFDHVRSRLADALSEEGKDSSGADGMDGVICAFSREMDEVEFSCANNPLLIFRNVDGKMEVIESAVDKMPVGRYEGDENAFTTHVAKLQPDDLLLLFTDGYSDQFGGEKGKRLMYRRMKEIVRSVADKDCEAINKLIAASFHEWKGSNDQIDDVLVLGIRI